MTAATRHRPKVSPRRDRRADQESRSPEDRPAGHRGDRFLEYLCTRRLDHTTFRRAYLDATYVKQRMPGGARYEAVVAATGIRPDGGVEILGIDVGDSESAEFWTRFFATLQARGLSGLRVVGSDEHGGLEEALDVVFPGACWEWSPGTSEPIRSTPLRTGERVASHPAWPRPTGWWVGSTPEGADPADHGAATSDGGVGSGAPHVGEQEPPGR